MSEFTKPVQDLGKEVLEYVDLRVDALKLQTAKGMSMTLGRLAYLLVVMAVLFVVLATLAIAGVLWLGEVVGSYAAGALIVCGVFLLALLVLFFLKNRMFRDAFVPMVSRIFFDGK